MVIEFTARHFHAPDNIRVYAESEVERLISLMTESPTVRSSWNVAIMIIW